MDHSIDFLKIQYNFSSLIFPWAYYKVKKLNLYSLKT